MFADDTNLWKKIEQESDSQELQEDLVCLSESNVKWLLKF